MGPNTIKLRLYSNKLRNLVVETLKAALAYLMEDISALLTFHETSCV